MNNFRMYFMVSRVVPRIVHCRAGETAQNFNWLQSDDVLSAASSGI